VSLTCLILLLMVVSKLTWERIILFAKWH
jgi:hypothetical protein